MFKRLFCIALALAIAFTIPLCVSAANTDYTVDCSSLDFVRSVTMENLQATVPAEFQTEFMSMPYFLVTHFNDGTQDCLFLFVFTIANYGTRFVDLGTTVNTGFGYESNGTFFTRGATLYGFRLYMDGTINYRFRSKAADSNEFMWRPFGNSGFTYSAIYSNIIFRLEGTFFNPNVSLTPAEFFSGETGSSSSGGTSWQPDSNFFENIKNAVQAGVSSAVSFIKGRFDDVVSWLSGIKQTLSDMFTSMADNFTAIRVALSTLPEDIATALDKTLNPNSPHLEGSFGSSVNTTLNNKFTFMQDFKGAFNQFNSEGHKLEFKANIFGREMVLISGAWFEPYRLYIRGGLSAIMYVALALSCFRLVSSIFGMGIHTTTGVVASDIKKGG